MTIKTRIIVSVFVLFLVSAAMLAATWIVTDSQKGDGLVINLAGRQRMLSQKIAKEALAFIASGNESHKNNLNPRCGGVPRRCA
ncbi:MAG: type IV pili methyl-accepting chemotaxis transducer N-terminal domain-containing protein [Puniceicoccales bacterium]